MQISLLLISQTFILLSVLEPLFNGGIRPLFDLLEDVMAPETITTALSSLEDILASLLIGVPGTETEARFMCS